MRFRIFDPITPAEDGMPLCNLGHLFNGYTSRLSSLEVAAYPQESLSRYHRLALASTGKSPRKLRPEARALRAAEQEFYCLAVLNNSLHDLHLCVLAACNILSDLFEVYEGDLRRYAIQTRLRCLASEVPGTEEDMQACFTPEEWAAYQQEWEPTGPGQPWRVKYKDDDESLTSYTVAACLLDFFFFPPGKDGYIELIGSTPPEEFAYFTEVVRTYSTSQPKASQLSEGAGVYRLSKQGEWEQQSVAQRVENEVNDELKDVRVASYFTQILERMQAAALLVGNLADLDSYRQLRDLLVSIRDCTGLVEPAQPFND